MKLKIIKYGGEERIIECDSFEFRTNQVANCIEIIDSTGKRELIHGVCVIRTEKENKMSLDEYIKTKEEIGKIPININIELKEGE